MSLGADEVDGRLGEQHPARLVEVAGQDVEALDAPTAPRMPNPVVETPIRPYAAAAVGRRELAGQPAYVVGGDAADPLGHARG